MTWGRDHTEWKERRAAERKANIAALLLPPRTLHKAVMGKAQTVAAPKSEPKRNAALLEMAQGRPCLLAIPDECFADRATTVSCHSNLLEHGKSKARKADDQYSVWGCMACHRWLDTSGAPREAKRARFMLAHLDQVIEWRRIAQEPSEPERFRKAARWALDNLNATD